jgi:hypothetical protein
MEETLIPDKTFPLHLSVRRYILTLLVTTLLLIAIHLGLHYCNYKIQEVPWLLLQLFDLDEENNIPTWFSSFLLLNNAFVLYLVSRSENVTWKRSWMFLAAGFLLLSLDEVAGIHETLHSSMEMNWAIPGGLLVLIIGVAFVPFLFSLPKKLALLFVLSGSIFVSGAIIFELLGEDMDSDSLLYISMTALEEGLEMFGALLFLWVLLDYMKQDDKIRIAHTVTD